MLSHIQIRDLAIVDQVELELGPGMTVLTGETGAGKSILVDALMLAAGGRAGSEVVRHGAERAEVSATFEVENNPAALAWLRDQAIEHEGECVLRRIVGSDGRSRAYLNGQAMPIQALRQLGELLLEVHGQMEYQSLVRKAAQRELLDRYAGNDAVLAQVGEQWRNLTGLREALHQARTANADRDARLELLKHHLEELQALDLRPEELDSLLAERTRHSQSGRLAAGAREVAGLLRDGEDAAAEHSVSRALTVTRALANLDSRLRPIAQLLEESLIGLREAGDSIDRYASDLDADPTRQEWVEQRLAAIEALARKHRVEPAALLATQAALEEELARLTSMEASIEALEQRLAAAEQAFQSTCAKLTRARRKSATELGERITTLMQTLGMPGGKFEVSVSALEPNAIGAHGADNIEFLVSANAGQPPRPLAKVASGGELSRISLAIQVAAVQNEALPCLVFDEVDAGVGGGVAEIVGRQLRALGEHAQALCVTHLPQVASQAHAHVRVTKLTDGTTTRTSLHTLSEPERVEEIARMLGGIDITDKAREHAAEMLKPGPRRKRASGAKR